MSAELDANTYEHLRALAHRIAGERHATLQPTALLHEAWEKLDRQEGPWESRRHFLSVAAMAMRQVLVDRAQANRAAKRGGGARRTTLAGLSSDGPDLDVLDLEAALAQLEAIDPQAVRLVVLRVYGGLTLSEACAELALAERSGSRKWRFARAYLRKQLDAGA